MLFKFFEYDCFINKKNNECIICFEGVKKNENTIKLNCQEIYFKFCDCNPYIHKSCLKTWFEINFECPICRNNMVENELYDFSYGFYIIKYIVFFKQNIKLYIKQIITIIVKSKIVLFFIYSITLMVELSKLC
jgi:hypothetical protein